MLDAANGTARPLEADSDCVSLGTEPSRSLSASDERLLRLGGGISGRLCEKCDDVARTVSRSRPVVPWHTRSEVPSACKPTTGRPEAKASSTTCPKVSVNDGNPKMLLLAYIEARRLPFWCPIKAASRPYRWQRRVSSARAGPSPTITSLAFDLTLAGNKWKASISKRTFFSQLIRPTKSTTALLSLSTLDNDEEAAVAVRVRTGGGRAKLVPGSGGTSHTLS